MEEEGEEDNGGCMYEGKWTAWCPTGWLGSLEGIFGEGGELHKMKEVMGGRYECMIRRM